MEKCEQFSFSQNSELLAGAEFRISAFSDWPVSSRSDSGCYVPGFPKPRTKMEG
jgi:hypothetical protein